MSDFERLFFGDGPGIQAQDGCSVELYRRLPYAGDIEFLADRLKPGVSVLELGCGTGRITRRLLDLGCTVTAVDNSAEMLAWVPGAARRVHADIEQLALDQAFDVVLLASGLVNHPSRRVRTAFLAAAAAHLAPGGRLILERQDPHWLRTAEAGPVGQTQGIAIELVNVARSHGLVEMTLRYTEGGSAWTHTFTLLPLDEPALQALLGDIGFGRLDWLDDRQRWASAGLQG